MVDVGRMPQAGTAMMVLATTEEPPAEAIDVLRASPGILSVTVLRG